MGAAEQITQETLDLAKSALSKATTTGILQSTGLQAYDLEAPSTKLYPVLTPMRNRIPRMGGFGTAVNWKQITAINAGNIRASVAEGTRNSFIQYTEADKVASYKSFGLDSKVTDEAIWTGRTFEDARALSSLAVLQSVMIEEEKLILGGMGTGLSTALGTPGTVVTSSSGAAATIPTLTYDVAVVALNLYGYMNSVSPTAVAIGAGSGHSIKSAVTTQAVTLGGHLFASVPAVAGAFAYAWFVGAAGAAKLEAITTLNSLDLTAIIGTGQLVTVASFASDESQDANAFSGLFPQIVQAGSGAYIKTMATGVSGTGTPLTADSAAGITEIDVMLKSLYDNSRISPTVIWCSTQEIYNITKKIINAGASSLLRITTTDGGAGNIQAGSRVGEYLNKYTQQVIPLAVHPFLPPGTMIAVSESLPYPNNNVPNVLVMRMVQEYQDQDFARTARQAEHGVYAMGCLQHYFPAGCGIITNIANA